MTTYGFIGKFDNGLDGSRVGLAHTTMERYSEGPLGVNTSIIVWPYTHDFVMGMPEHNNEKEEQNR